MPDNNEASGLFISTALTDVALAAPSPGLIAQELFQPLSTSKMEGKIWRKDPNRAKLLPNSVKRAIGGEAYRLYKEKADSVPFIIEDHSLSDLIPDETRGVVDVALQDDIDTTEDLKFQIDLKREQEMIANFVASFTGTATDTPSEKFNAASPTKDPTAVLTGYINTMGAACGRKPNVIAMDLQVAQAIVFNAKFQERMKYTLPPDRNNASASAIADVLRITLGVDRVLLAEYASYNAAKKGKTASLTNIWGEYIVMLYQEKPSTRFGGFGFQLKFNGVMQRSANAQIKIVDGKLVETGRVARRFSDEIIVHDWYQDLIVNATAGFLVTNTLE